MGTTDRAVEGKNCDAAFKGLWERAASVLSLRRRVLGRLFITGWTTTRSAVMDARC